jgi:putative ubiquitin-RnfH superfamily antitoxin RatB of RatAB toxin-antitoxin module
LLTKSRASLRGDGANAQNAVLDAGLTQLTPSCHACQIFTFYKAQGKKTGASLVEEDKVELAKSLMARCALRCMHVSSISLAWSAACH